MEALIIVAHGSKVHSSNEEIIEITNKIRLEVNDEVNHLITHAFLEITEPSIFHSINKAVLENCKVIKIFPYFLAAGKHVQEDIPNEIKRFKKRFPEIDFILLPHFGKCAGIESMILKNS